MLSDLDPFQPSHYFSSQARVSSLQQYEELYAESINSPDTFWGREAAELSWKKDWSQVCAWQAPFAKWFVDAKVNIAENCLDRHILAGNGEKVAFWSEKENGESEAVTYSQLTARVCKFANVLLAQNVKPKDRVIIYMPMVVEAVVAMLACVRIGAVHSVVFGGFSAESIRDRILDSGARLVITADGGRRRGKPILLKKVIDEAICDLSQVEKVIYCQNVGCKVEHKEGRDLKWETLEQDAPPTHDAQGFDSEHPLFILYTSGSTGKPKGILHTTGGYMVGTYCSSKYIFDLNKQDVFWCTADVGWITGHSYVVYGPLLNGATQVIYEGAPNYPDFSRFWQLVEKFKVTIFYTAPTAIRAFVKAGDEFIEGHDLTSLRLLGSVGEPINPDTWKWYYDKIGNGRCPIVDTWWQTETGAIMITSLPGATPMIPGTATKPFFGIDAAVLDAEGTECEPDQKGKLVIRKPWPSMLRNIFGDEQRYIDTYWNDFEGYYTAGDGAKKDSEGNIQIIGRLDDVINVSGHRIGTAEIESVLVADNRVAEAAVVAIPHEIKGEGIHCFVTLNKENSTELNAGDLEKQLKAQVASSIGAFARPEALFFSANMPKTRSGKIMRRLLKELLITGNVKGNTTTLEDDSVIDQLKQEIKAHSAYITSV